MKNTMCTLSDAYTSLGFPKIKILQTAVHGYEFLSLIVVSQTFVRNVGDTINKE